MVKLNFEKIILLIVVFIILAVILYEFSIKSEKACDCNDNESIIRTAVKTTEIKTFKKDLSLLSIQWLGFSGDITDIKKIENADEEFCFYNCVQHCRWMDYYYKSSVVIFDFYSDKEISRNTDLCSCECYINREEIS